MSERPRIATRPRRRKAFGLKLFLPLAWIASCARPGQEPVPAPPEGFWSASETVQLFYRISAGGPDTVVVIHGGPALGLEYLAPDLEPLTREFALLAYDQRGSGRSTVPTEDRDLGLEHHVADLEALRRHFGLRRLTLIGHSWGGSSRLNMQPRIQTEPSV